MKEWTMQLFDYHVWANDRLIQHLKGLPEAVFLNKVNSVFPTVAGTFGHMIAVDELWYLRMKGNSLQQIVSKSFSTIEDTVKASTVLHNEIKDFLINTEDVEAMAGYQNTKGDQFNNKIAEVVQHIVNHGTYHRGNIAAMIRQMGYEGVSTDYIFYLRGK
ncbi:DinB family protein [Peribacillus asahii]|uniref:DinB family protein n=1 Tax=Peribacillus asahii TaxID=228899 RepID=UPI00207AA26D|nr:DinB family protein [Peribacillus asahii]USK70035.1 DinB family protein [Peribacillus asahii]